jgi:DNA-binding FrmR family transcriptional regulator
MAEAPETTPLRGYARSGDTAGLVARLRRIEGQVRGLQRMLEEGRYCVDVLTQIDAVTAALARVQDQILEAHLEHCVPEALEGEDLATRRQKVDEIVDLLRQFRRPPSRGPE